MKFTTQKSLPLIAAPRPKTGVSATEEETSSTIGIRDMLTGVKAADGNVYAQRAWVGSAADFDKFDLGYVGTGEGAQVHGWGLYFAQRREVAEGYRKKLSNSLTIIYDGKKQEDITGDIKDAIQPFSMQLKKPSDLKDVSDEHPSERKENEKGVSSQRIRVIDPGEGRKTPFLDHRLAGGLSVVKDCL